ncbi:MULTISPECIES: protein jag [Fusobacterium]|jgi:spoIIIJ-associated protein|uniref:Jag family protein n=1 Tax=Fusobacterium TaxID=848 RepID=UPI0008A56314|nr:MULTISPECIES: R3H domain-containing nucleic acid-binding protein [Fusobacterium]MCD7979433.1 KH domain-containing protein [Fusobacterium sp.]MCF0172019.1 KH domain-containing protein [Fusobacterium varium]MCF2672808.1 KH domain-containing protein [Fusobacterium varium]MCI6032705.1 KH domain-containing protein [Fusobacterium varium]MDY4005823.1 R3H domain-containing nucleic acid-binding protein [Fusobacterium varium]
MSNVIEIKAMNKEQAITRALKILEASPEQVVRVKEKQKSLSFLGLFNREGIYEIEIDKELKKETIKTEIKKDIKTEIKEHKKKESREHKEKIEIKEKQYKETVTTREKLEEAVDASDLVEAKAKELLEYIGLNLRVDVNKVHDRTYLVNLYGEDNGIIIGKKGKTLNSFEYLLNSLLKEYRIEVDVEGFKEKRNQTLRELGKKMAEKALKTNKAVRLNPMPPRERKVIHEVVNKYPELDTFSEGRDPKRYIVIKRKK